MFPASSRAPIPPAPSLRRWKEHTRGGYAVRIHYEDRGGTFPIHGDVFLDGDWMPNGWTLAGYHLASYEENDFDLMPYVQPMQVVGEAASAVIERALAFRHTGRPTDHMLAATVIAELARAGFAIVKAYDHG